MMKQNPTITKQQLHGLGMLLGTDFHTAPKENPVPPIKVAEEPKPLSVIGSPGQNSNETIRENIRERNECSKAIDSFKAFLIDAIERYEWPHSEGDEP